jgi:glycosyltransferase involved in cell wall biosynthesis
MSRPADPSLLILGDGFAAGASGGAARVVSELHRSLRPLIDVRTLVLGPLAEPVDGVRAVRDPSTPLGRRLWGFAAAAAAEAPAVDVVEAHFALYAALPLLAGRFRRNAFVSHFHGPWADESGASGESAVCVRAKRLIEGAVYRRAPHLVVHSHAFERLLVETYGVRPWDVHVVPPGVDLEQFTPGDRNAARARLDVPESSDVVASVRRLVPRMGIGDLLEACARIEPDRRSRLVLLIGGEGPERPRLEAKAAGLGLGNHVRFLGRLSEEELPDVYRASDLCVVPSLALEGFGLVVLEALACGTPVLATDVGGLAEALGDLDSSLVVPPGDVDSLARRIEQALAQPKSLPGPRRCRRRAERFSWRASAERHLEVYRRAHAAKIGVAPPRRPRIVFLDHCALLSGAELALVRLLQALGDSIEPHVVLGEEGPLLARLRAAGISAEVLPAPRAMRETRRDRIGARLLPGPELTQTAAYTVALARRLRRLQPDLVHANSLKALLYGGLAGRLARVPVVWQVHDRIADDYLPRAGVRLVGSLARFLPAAVIANSTETLERLHAAANGATRRLPQAVIYYPVDLRPLPKAANGGPLLVGMVGRIAPWKGQDVFLHAFARAFARGEERASIVGAPLFGEQRYDESLRHLVSRLGIAERVDFVGFRDDIAAELARLDVLVHASRLPEPLGQVVQEGMRAGLPVVAADAGGPAEVIAPGETGFLFPPGDVHALAETLTTLAGDAPLRARVGEAAAVSSRAFDPERIAPQVLDLYETVLER